MSLTDDMNQLSEKILQSYEERTVAIDDLRQDVAAYRQHLQTNNADLRAAMTARLREYGTDRKARATARRRELADYVDTLRHNVATQLDDAHAAHQAMAADQRRALVAYTEALQHDVATQLDDAHAAHQAMAADQRQQLDTYIDTLRHDTAVFLLEQDSAHHVMQNELRERLTNDRQQLTQEVSALRSSWTTDHGTARQAWQSFESSMQQRRSDANGPTAPAPKMEEAYPLVNQER